MSEYNLAVETGGTKTQLTIADACGKICFSARCGGVGVVGDADLTELKKTVDELKKTIPAESVKNVVINVGGTNTQQLETAFSEMFPSAQVSALRESSGVIMKAICEMEKADVLLMAGTGIICLCIGKNGSMITDAWGPLTGDKGSGYKIGIEAISKSLLALEGKEPLFLLAQRITGRNEPFSAVEDTTVLMKLRDEVRNNFTPLDRMKAAGYAKIAADCAREGDKMAQQIFDEAGEQLAETVLRGVRLAGCENPVRIFISGGLSKCNDLWSRSFEQKLGEEISYTLCLGEADMTKGIFYMLNKKGDAF